MNHLHAIEKNIEYLPVIFLTPSMQELYQQGRELAGSGNPSILIMGESGTGKELLAKSIHYTISPNTPFLTIHCMDMPFDHFQEQIERYFSHDTSSAASGSHDTEGNSTLFLRDIGRLDSRVQKNLFDFIRKKVSRDLDSTCSGPRLMFSCNQSQPLQPLGSSFSTEVLQPFEPSLLSILPLRERRDDIKPLAGFFVDKFSKEYGKDVGGIHSSALKVLEAYHWPGNVSELRDVMENATLLAQGPLITNEDIRFNISKKSIALESFLCREDFFTLEEIERIYIQTVLRRVKNNKSRAAKILGVSRNTLQRRLNSLDDSVQKKKNRGKSRNQPSLF